MDADERLTALKKAYADIILNTAKEAASRVMVSERKAIRFQHELNVTKEQALQMLLRLKLMVDSKISESEMTSLTQQRKIEELEAQLHEAEDIVKDLREELREVQTELERVRNSKLRHMDEHDTATREPTLQENRLNTSQSIIFPPRESQLESFTASDIKNSAFNQRNEVCKFYNVNDNRIGHYYVGKPDLPSSSEENRLNTCQSNILPPPESRLESVTASDMKNSDFSQRNEVYKCYSANDFRMGNSYVSKPNLPSIILRSKETEPYRNRRTQRIRAFEEKLMAGELAFSDPIDDVNYETSGREDGEGQGIHKTEEKDVVRAVSVCYQVPKVKSSRRKRRRVTRYKKNKTPSTRHLSNQALKRDQTSDIPCTVANSVNNNAQSCGDPSNMAQRSSADTTDKGTPLGCAKVTESDAEFVKAVSVENTTNKEKVLIDKISLMRQESGSADSSGVPSCGMNVQKIDMPVVNLQTITSGTTNGIPHQSVTHRVIKYTFQRKRKKESLSSPDGNASLETSILKKKEAEKHNGSLEMEKMEKSSSITESSRGSRRVAQVARQLVSLSEKKWWQ